MKYYHGSINPHIFSKDVEQIPTRNGYGDGVVEAGEKNDQVTVLCCDLTDSTRSKKFKDTFPDRFLELGIQEQNMAGVAAGMALEGKIPFCSSYAVFNPGRNWDQIRVSVCYNKANVKIVGAHAGISVGPDGATHQALEDIASVRPLPNMTIIAPCDYEETRKATIALAEFVGPAYIRFAREKTPVITTKRSPFKIGKAQVLREGKDATIIACGPLVYQSLMAAEELYRQKKLQVRVINCPTIKPLDKKTIVAAAKETKRIVTVEEHQIHGGLGGAVAELLAQEAPVPMRFVGMPDSFGESGKPSELLDKYGMNVKTIKKRVMELIVKQ